MKDGIIVFPTVDLEEDRKLTLAAQIEAIEDEDGNYIAKVASFGYSIKNPEDSNNPELAKIIARGRAHKSPIFVFSTLGKDMPRELLNKVANVLQEDFKNRFSYYVKVSPKKKVEKV